MIRRGVECPEGDTALVGWGVGPVYAMCRLPRAASCLPPNERRHAPAGSQRGWGGWVEVSPKTTALGKVF